jgi:hypothetical protein
MSKQTAVEWLYEVIDNELVDFLDNRIDLNELSVAMLKAKAKAKEMENEQMVEAYTKGAEMGQLIMVQKIKGDIQ